jgi:hypothetical protein
MGRQAMNERMAVNVEAFSDIMAMMMLVLYLGAYGLSFFKRRSP